MQCAALLLRTAGALRSATAVRGNAAATSVPALLVRQFAGLASAEADGASNSANVVPPSAALAPNISMDEATQRYLERQRLLEEAQKTAEAVQRTIVTAVPVVDLASGQPTGQTVQIDERIATAPIRPDIVHRVIVWQEKNNRETLYKAKARAEVRGGGKKPWKQKGTGRARAGSSRSPLWIGGGVAHPPKLRDWDIKLQKKVRRLGMRIALAAKLRDGRLTVVPALELPQGSMKTKDALAALEKHQATGKRTLWIDDADVPASFAAAVGNIPRTRVLPAIGANVKDIVMAEKLFITPAALDSVTARITREM